MERDEDFSKAARNGPSQGPGESSMVPRGGSARQILRPESISVVRCVELFEASGEGRRGKWRKIKGSFCPSPENSGASSRRAEGDIAGPADREPVPAPSQR